MTIPVQQILSLWLGRGGGSTTSAAKVTLASVFKAYYSRDKEFDKECEGYQGHIETLIDTYTKHPIKVDSVWSSPVTSGVAPERDESLCHMLLLDQFTRNIWRGDDAKKVYTVTDPIAKSLALYMISKQWHRDMNWLEGMFLILPLGHSEDLNCHVLAQQVYSDLLVTLAKKVEAGTADKQELKEAIGVVQPMVDHLKIVNEYGRFPHRNGMIGRPDTAEEADYFKKGGTTFGSDQ